MSENVEAHRSGARLLGDNLRDLTAHGPSVQLMLALAQRLSIGGVVFEFADGSLRSVDGPNPGPRGIMQLHNERVARRLFTGGNIGIAEAYMDGDFDSPDLADFLTVAAMNIEILDRTLRGRWWFRTVQKLTHALNRNSRSGSRRNIAYHYDLGNDFYAEWLDPSMTYSSAEFEHEDQSLEAAQQAKYRNLVERMAPPDGGHVLEIGCGWGGFAEHLATSRDVKLTCITISKEQHDYAAERMQRLGLNEKVEIRLQDYRDVEGQFDGIASIEMFEAVGRQYWPRYFQTVRDRLRDGARAALQIITIADHAFDEYALKPDFIQRYIFPGGMLPSPSLLVQEYAQAGLRQIASDKFGLSYARTLREWDRRFQAAWPTLKDRPGFDERFKRMWEYYLAYCEAGFRAGQIDVVRVTLDKG